MDIQTLRDIGKDIKLIALDLDGTLLNSQKTIDPRTMDAIRRARAAGITVTFSTGRAFATLGPYLKAAEVVGPVISCNGAEVIDAETGNEIRRAVIPEDEVISFLNYASKYDIEFCEMATDASYGFKGGNHENHHRVYHTMGNPNYPFVYFRDGHFYEPGVKAVKINFGPMNEAQFKAMMDYIASRPALAVTTGSNIIYELICAGCSKGDGLRVACEHLGITTAQAASFGDAPNDLSSLEAAGLSVAMGNADDIVKERCMYITDSNDDNGIGNVIDKLILFDKQ